MNLFWIAKTSVLGHNFPMALQGSLRDLPLAELVQSLGLNRKTGAVFLYHDAQEGALYLLNGAVAHAAMANLEGEEAFYLMAAWKDGRFTFEDGRRPEKNSIRRQTSDLLMEAARREDEWRQVESGVPEEAVPAFPEGLPGSEMDMNTHDWTVLSHVDGSRSVAEIIRRCERDGRHVRRVLMGLLRQGVLVLKTNG